jgi:hypothetical protein
LLSFISEYLLFPPPVNKHKAKHRLNAFVNRMLRRIFGLKREEVPGGWGELHNEGLQNL